MKAFNDGVKLYCNNIIYNIIITLLLAFASTLIIIILCQQTFMKHRLNTAQPLLDNGLIYLSSFNIQENSMSHKYDKNDFEGCESVFKIYSNKAVLNNELINMFIYDEDLLNMMGLNIRSGRFPEQSEYVEVLALGDRYKLGQIYTITLSGEEIEILIVGKIADSTLLLAATATSSGDLGLANLFYDPTEIDNINCIVGLKEDFNNFISNNFLHRNIFIKYSNSYLLENKNLILDELNAFGYAHEYNSMYEYSEKIMREELTILIVILSLACIIGTMMLIINLIMLFNSKIKYFTVLYVNGYSIRNIITLLSCYILIVVGMGAAISYFFIMLLFPKLYPNEELFNSYIYFIPFIMGIILFIIAVCISNIQLRSDKLNEKITSVLE